MHLVNNHGTDLVKGGGCGDNGTVRISLKVDYALRAMVQLAAEGGGRPVKAEHVAAAQDIPLRFLLGILSELKRAGLARSHRGTDGGWALARPAAGISLADVVRALEGRLADVHETPLAQLSYPEPATLLRDVWMALRTSIRSVLETVTLADLAAGQLPEPVRAMAEQYRSDVRH